MVRGALDVAVDRVLADQVAGVAAADAGGLHAPVGGQVGRAERQALHAGRGGADLLDVGDAAGGLEDGVDEDRLGEAGLRLELGEEPVDVVDVLGALDLRDHDHVELVADLGDRGGEVVEDPGRVEALTRVQSWVSPAVKFLATSTRPARAASLFAAGTPSSRLARMMSTLVAMSGHLGRPSSGSTPGRSGSSATGGTGSPAAARAHRRASGRKKSFGLRMRRTLGPRPERVAEAARAARRSERAADESRIGGAGPAEQVEYGTAMYEWSDEQLMVRDAVRQFIDKEIRPNVDELEHGDTPPYDVLRKLFATFGMDSAARDRFKKQMEFEKAVAAAVASGRDAAREARARRATAAARRSR